MIASWLSDQELLLGPTVALLLFLLVFAGVLVWIFRPGSDAAYEHEAMLPFTDEEPSGGDAAQALERNHGTRA